jgi:hypothetical protein
MHVIIAGSDMNGSTPEYLLLFILAVLEWLDGLHLDSDRVASILGHNIRGDAAGCICGLYAVLNLSADLWGDGLSGHRPVSMRPGGIQVGLVQKLLLTVPVMIRYLIDIDWHNLYSYLFQKLCINVDDAEVVVLRGSIDYFGFYVFDDEIACDQI